MCELNNSNEIYLADNTKYYCQNQINKFNDKVCKIVPINVGVRNFTTSLIFSKEKCLGGVYIDIKDLKLVNILISLQKVI